MSQTSSSPRRVAITGIGAVSPVGNTAAETWAALIAGLGQPAHMEHYVHYDRTLYPFLAAYLGLVLVQKTGMNPFLTLIVVIPVMAALGWLLQSTLLNTALRKQLKVAAQSTIVVFKEGRESARLIGQTEVEQIRSVLQTAL